MITAMEINPEKIFTKDFFSFLPFDIALLDKKYNVVWANELYKENFGETNGKTCYTICKQNKFPCQHCRVPEAFETGETVVSYESIVDVYGKQLSLAVYFIPIKGDNGEIKYVLEVQTHQSDMSQWQKEFSILFESVPSFITVIDRDYNIVRSNERFRDTFGDNRGKTCFEAYKKKKTVCSNCPAVLTFEDGEEHVSTQIGVTSTGEKSHYIVTTSPISFDDKGVSLVMEIANDITELNKLQEQLKNAHDFYSNIINNTADGIIALDNKGKIQIINDAAKKILGWKESKKPGINTVHDILPKDFFAVSKKDDFKIDPMDHQVIDMEGNTVPVIFSAIELFDKKKSIGRVAFMQDMRPFKELESKSKKNEIFAKEQILHILEKAMDMLLSNLINEFENLESTIYSNNPELVRKQLEVFRFKFKRTRIIKDAFISNSKKQLINYEEVDLVKIAKKIYDEYNEQSIQRSFNLKLHLDVDSLMVKANAISISSVIDILFVNALNNSEGTVEKPTLELCISKDDNVAVIQIAHISEHKLPRKITKDDCVGFYTSEMILRDHHGVLDLLNKDKAYIYKMKIPIEY